MNYSAIKYNCIENGPGIRTSLFVSGCRRHCKGCHNAEAWDFNAGKPFGDAEIEDILKSLEPEWVSGLSILGGEPFEPENLDGLIRLCDAVYEKYGLQKTVWIYSGFTLEELVAKRDYWILALLNNCDILVDGAYEESLRDLTLPYRGSRNQRIIDIFESFCARKAVIWQKMEDVDRSYILSRNRNIRQFMGILCEIAKKAVLWEGDDRK